MSRWPEEEDEEEEGLAAHGMLSLHRVFEVLAAQLTHGEAAALSLLLGEALRASGDGGDGDGDGDGAAPRGRREPRDARELLLELERRGLCHEGDLGLLRRLLRLLARHDLLRCVTLKRPRPVSPERPPCVPALGGSCPSPAQPRPEHWETGSSSGKRKRNSRSSRNSRNLRNSQNSRNSRNVRNSRNSRNVRNSRRPRRPLPHREPPQDPPEPPARVTCDIRLRVRAEYCEHERALRRAVASSRPRGPGRALDVFGQASGVLKARDLGSILCDIKFSELAYLEAFWGDYLSGALLEALKGVFLTEGLRGAVGHEDVRLLVSVDQDDYEAGRRLLMGAGQRGGRG
ncbi:DNA-binding death effector domain-containing protein 2 isoform X4 [Zonotrichia albicollis]|uniref:DNA-binding death effector domain-containing protein 2 isoform X3 n=1 Tax=Zonotrichia albicollis TaxID=44394 RepID=UPI003D80B578